jgi:hypothetical protein
MNATSSRAHTIFQIVLKQTSTTQLVDGDSLFSEKSSRINLIDLAGSERVSKTNATGQRLKEGSCINVSLTTLGNVINKLAEASNDSGKNVFVPYRDSILTWLLKDSLGGNSKTIMVAAISPSDFNYSETLSTLRYANRAKNIKNKAIINEDANIAIIRELKEEIERLKSLLSHHENGEKMIQNEKEKSRLVDDLEEARNIIESLQRTPLEMERRSAELSQLRKQALDDAGLLEQEEQPVILSDGNEHAPHFFNLNEDPMLNGMLVYFLKEGETTIGSNKELNKVVLGGPMIQPQHCTVNASEGKIKLTPMPEAMVFRNGKRVTDMFDLAHGDRIILGGNHVFRFSDLASDDEEKKGELNDIDWEFAHKELIEEQGINEIISRKELEWEQAWKERKYSEEMMKKELEWEEAWKAKKLKQLEEEFERERQKMMDRLAVMELMQVSTERVAPQVLDEPAQFAPIQPEETKFIEEEQVTIEPSQPETSLDLSPRRQDNHIPSSNKATPLSAESQTETSSSFSPHNLNLPQDMVINPENKRRSMIVYEHEIEEIQQKSARSRPVSTQIKSPQNHHNLKDRMLLALKKKGSKKSGARLDKQLVRALPLIKEANELCRTTRPFARFDLKILIDQDSAPSLRIHEYDTKTGAEDFLDNYEFEQELSLLRDQHYEHQTQKRYARSYTQGLETALA